MKVDRISTITPGYVQGTIDNTAARPEITKGNGKEAITENTTATQANDKTETAPEHLPFRETEADQQKIRSIEKFIKQITGRDYNIHIPQSVIIRNAQNEVIATINTSDPQRAGIGVIYHKLPNSYQNPALQLTAEAAIAGKNGADPATVTVKLKAAADNAQLTFLALNNGEKPALQTLSLNSDTEQSFFWIAGLATKQDAEGETDAAGTDSSQLQIWTRNEDDKQILFAVGWDENDGLYVAPLSDVIAKAIGEDDSGGKRLNIKA